MSLGQKEEFVHLQCCIDGSSPIEYNITTHVNKHDSSDTNFKKYRKDIEFVINDNVVHEQMRLRDIHLSPVELVFKAEEMFKEEKISKDQIINGLWRNFPLYNLSDDYMEHLIIHMRKSFDRKKRVIIPKKLLSLAVLNFVDSYLKKKTTSRYIKTKYIKDLSTGRRSYATRTLKSLGYLEEHGNCWRRTDKVFDEKDFVE